MTDDEIVAEAKAVYNKEMIDTFLNGYLSMLYLLANVAQIESIPRQILKKISTPERIGILFELYQVVNSSFQIKIIRLIDSLLKNDLPVECFN